MALVGRPPPGDWRQWVGGVVAVLALLLLASDGVGGLVLGGLGAAAALALLYPRYRPGVLEPPGASLSGIGDLVGQLRSTTTSEEWVDREYSWPAPEPELRGRPRDAYREPEPPRRDSGIER